MKLTFIIFLFYNVNKTYYDIVIEKEDAALDIYSK